MYSVFVSPQVTTAQLSELEKKKGTLRKSGLKRRIPKGKRVRLQDDVQRAVDGVKLANRGRE